MPLSYTASIRDVSYTYTYSDFNTTGLKYLNTEVKLALQKNVILKIGTFLF